LIPIRKGAAPPGLIRSGSKYVQVLRDAYDAHPELYQTGKRLAIRQSTYKTKAVKKALAKCHHGKCCYCETWIPEPYAHSHVEHWRPKSSSRQGRDDKSIWPGYYWLAYDWNNLLWSCAFCNSANKGDLFPLVTPAARARNHRMSVDDETPAILKPDGLEDLREHIKYELDEVIGLTDLGKKTIEVLRLNSKFQGARLRHFATIRQARERYIHLVNSVDPKACEYAFQSRSLIEDAAKPEQPYSAMVSAYLETNPLPDPAADIGVAAKSA
jgi:uncharacterized protein (TIGR02646 family)